MAAAPCLDGSTHPTVGGSTRRHQQLYSDNILQNFNKYSVDKCTLYLQHKALKSDLRIYFSNKNACLFWTRVDVRKPAHWKFDFSRPRRIGLQFEVSSIAQVSDTWVMPKC